MLQEIAAYFNANSESFLAAVRDHIALSTVSLAIALLVGVVGGVLCVVFSKINTAAQTAFQTMRIIPSLAVLLLLIPVVGTGTKPAVIALVILGIPPILLNTVAGLRGVPGSMLETAAGMGMTPFQTWRKVRFPLAMPTILAGVKIAYIEVVSSATLAAKIGAGGLGEIIFTGLGLYRTDLLLAGGIGVALLALTGACLLAGVGRVFFRH